MKVCFIVEECYRQDSMPLAVASKMASWGHDVDVLEPGKSLARVSELIREPAYDAWILKTVSDGPGLSLLEAAAASGMTTINDARAIRPVRDKAVAAALAGRYGLPFPLTYFAAIPKLLREVPDEHYPLVVKPANGSSGRGVHMVDTPRALADIQSKMNKKTFMLAQPYVANPGVDLKIYNSGGELHATVQRSPLHPDRLMRGHTVELAADLAKLVADIGAVFGLDLYGVDVVEGPNGWVVVDINDFPSFHCVPNAVAKVAKTILRLAASRRDTASVPTRPFARQAPDTAIRRLNETRRPVLATGRYEERELA
jgi:ribosomal protein S6--L-glutamate ligase